MTSGTKTIGTPNGPGSWTQKTWVGSDWSSRSRPQRPLSERIGYDSIRMRVHRGTQVITIIHRYTQKVSAKTRVPRRAQVEEHNYDVSVTRGQLSNIPYFYNGAGPFTTRLGGINGIPQYMPSAAEKANVQLALLGKLRERVAGSDFNAGVFLGESKEALATIRDGAERIHGALSSFRRGRPYEAAQRLVGGTPREHLYSRKIAANNWLQLQYGWLPLLKDVKDGAEFISHQLNYPRQEVVRVRRSGVPNGLGSGYFPDTGDVRWSRFEKEYSVSIKATLRETNAVLLSGLLDPVQVAWELVPYSFVVDWFIPVGNYLNALSLNTALTGIFVTTERQRWRISNPVLVQPGPPFYYPGLGVAAGDYYEQFRLTRTVSSSLSVPLPGFKDLSKALSWKHTVNAVALLSQVIK